MTNIRARGVDTQADFSTYHGRLKWARGVSGITQKQVCAIIGMTQGAYSQLEAKGTGSEKTASIARALGVNPLWLEAGEECHESHTQDANYVSVRRVGVKANGGITGEPAHYIEEDGEPIYFQRSWLASQGYKAELLMSTTVNGSSMEPTIYHGDLVVFNLAEAMPIDGAVFVANAGGEVVVKRLVRDGGQWWMDSDNPDKIRYPRKQCGDDVALIGHVILRQSTRV